MTLTLKPWHGILLIVLAVIFVFTHSSEAPYSNNHFHGHRWRTEYCKKAGLPIAACAITMPMMQNVSSETAMFDICLEHGEWRRIK
jgi:hypothetical protein